MTIDTCVLSPKIQLFIYLGSYHHHHKLFISEFCHVHITTTNTKSSRKEWFCSFKFCFKCALKSDSWSQRSSKRSLEMQTGFFPLVKKAALFINSTTLANHSSRYPANKHPPCRFKLPVIVPPWRRKPTHEAVWKAVHDDCPQPISACLLQISPCWKSPQRKMVFLDFVTWREV